MKKKWNGSNFLAMAFLAIMVAVLAGCGSCGSEPALSSNGAMANKGTVPIDIQIFEIPGAAPTTANRAVMMVASASDLLLRTKIDHVNFQFIDENGYANGFQTLTVKQGNLSGTLSADPGTYTLEADFMTKGITRIYHAFCDVTIVSGQASKKAVLVMAMDVLTAVPAVMHKPNGQFTVGKTYQVDIAGSNYNGGDWGATFDANADLRFSAPYLLKPMVNDVKIIITDDNGVIHSATFTFDLLKAIGEADVNGYVAFTWPAPGTVTVGGIFADDETGYIKANINYDNTSPTRGQVGGKIVNFTLENLTVNGAYIKGIEIKMWDGNYLGNLSLSAFGITLGACSSVSATDWGSNTYRCAVDVYIPVGTTMAFNLSGDISGNYPSNEMLGTDLPAITAVDANGNSIPFLQPIGTAIGVN